MVYSLNEIISYRKKLEKKMSVSIGITHSYNIILTYIIIIISYLFSIVDKILLYNAFIRRVSGVFFRGGW